MGARMADRETTDANRGGRLMRLEAKNARLRRLAAELGGDIGEFPEGRGPRRGNGAVDPAHLLLVGATSNSR
jgi:hypothetical protein